MQRCEHGRQCQDDRADQRDQDVAEWEHERDVEPDRVAGERNDAARKHIAERDSEQPAPNRDDEPLGCEDAPNVTCSGADAAEHADLTGALEHGHGDRVDQADHADRDDQQSEDRDRARDLCVGGDVLLLGVVVDQRRDLVTVCRECVLDTGRGAVDESVVL